MSLVTVNAAHVAAIAELIAELPKGKVGEIDLLEDEYHSLQVTVWAGPGNGPTPQVLAHVSISVAGTVRDRREVAA